MQACQGERRFFHIQGVWRPGRGMSSANSSRTIHLFSGAIRLYLETPWDGGSIVMKWSAPGAGSLGTTQSVGELCDKLS